MSNMKFPDDLPVDHHEKMASEIICICQLIKMRRPVASEIIYMYQIVFSTRYISYICTFPITIFHIRLLFLWLFKNPRYRTCFSVSKISVTVSVHVFADDLI